jgi:hypothetical protein
MVRYYGLGLLTPGVGLFHLVFSSSGVVTMSILGDRDSMPDPAFYRECVEKAFQELLDAVKADISKQEAEAKKPKARKKAPAKKAVKKAGSGAVAKAPVKKARAASTKASSTKSAATAKRSRASSGAAEPVESILKPEAEVSSGAASNVVSLSAESGK